LNIQSKAKNPNGSEDLTVVLLKGNSSPRSFRIPLFGLYRSLTFLGFTFFTALLLSGVFVLYLSYQSWTQEELAPRAPQNTQPPTVTIAETIAAPSTEVAATVTITTTATATATVTAITSSSEEVSSSLWNRIAGSFSKKSNQDSKSETEKEIVGLREQVAALNNKADGRAELNSGDGPITLLPSKSTLIAKSENLVEVKNISLSTDAGKTKLKFEIHNTDLRNKQVRGYIVAIAKSPDALFIYPTGTFAPKDNILVNYTKGETFAVSRFREAIATFPETVTGKGFQFQILLFRSDGKMISHQHVEKK